MTSMRKTFGERRLDEMLPNEDEVLEANAVVTVAKGRSVVIEPILVTRGY